jgi:hypothetical protein
VWLERVSESPANAIAADGSKRRLSDAA